MTAPEPPAVPPTPDMRWSASEQAAYSHPEDAPDHWARIEMSPPVLASWCEDLPADAVRLVPDDMDLLDANEKLGEALTEIGLALGLPKPRPGATWGRREILARIGEIIPDVNDQCQALGGPHGVGGLCALPDGHELHRDGIGGEWAGAVPDTLPGVVAAPAELADVIRVDAELPDTVPTRDAVSHCAYQRARRALRTAVRYAAHAEETTELVNACRALASITDDVHVCDAGPRYAPAIERVRAALAARSVPDTGHPAGADLDHYGLIRAFHALGWKVRATTPRYVRVAPDSDRMASVIVPTDLSAPDYAELMEGARDEFRRALLGTDAPAAGRG